MGGRKILDAALISNEVVDDLVIKKQKESYVSLTWRKHAIT